jgi:CubicO group peptidase (beta-lactamase class C family)
MQNTTNKPTLPRSMPELQGIASHNILNFINEVNLNIRDLHSFMLLRNGFVVAEGWWYPYQPSLPHMLYSLSKSFASTAIGFAVAEGLLNLDDPVLPYLAEDAPDAPSINVSTMRVKHMLSMSTGHHIDTLQSLFSRQDGNWSRAFLSQEVAHEPGSYFVYNTGATYMLSVILQKITNQTLLEYLQPRLLAPLGIEGATWETCPRGYNVGGWGMKITTEDIARFGQLYLQNGLWHGEQILPKGWVATASAFHSNNDNDTQTNIDWRQGYGYQFWLCRHGAYRGDGAFGQFCIVMPEQQVVIAITSGVSEMQPILDLIWEHLLPAFGTEPLPHNLVESDRLRRTLANLQLPTVNGLVATPTASRHTNKTFLLGMNDLNLNAVHFDFNAQGCKVKVSDRFGDYVLGCGYGDWQMNHSRLTAMDGKTPQSMALSGAWVTESMYEIKICLCETPYVYTWQCQFADDSIEIIYKANVSFIPISPKKIVGKIAQ